MAVIGNDQIGRSAANAVERVAAYAKKMFGRARRNAGRPAPALVRGVEALLAIAIALAAAHAAAPFFAPAPAPAPPAEFAQSAAPDQSGPVSPFRIAAAPAAGLAQAAPQAAATNLDLALHGTWVDGAGGSAIIRTPDGLQKTYAIGDAVCCGATLAAVYPDQAIIERAGARESLRLLNKIRGADAPALAAVTAAPATGVAARFSEIVRVQAAEGAGGKMQLRLFPAADEEAFELAGLRPGDLLVAIGNQPAPTDLAALLQLIPTLSDASGIRVTIERDGVRVPMDIILTDGLGATE